MIHKKVNRILIMVLVCIMLFNFTLSPVANAEPVTLATAWGGVVIAKEVMAMVVALAGAGITLATHDDAWNMYQDLKNNNQSLLSQIISVQPAIWTGAYNEVTEDLNNIKDGFFSWLTCIFGTLQHGANSINETSYMYGGYPISVYFDNATNDATLTYLGESLTQKLEGDMWLGKISNVYISNVYIDQYKILRFEFRYKLNTIDRVRGLQLPLTHIDLSILDSTQFITQANNLNISISADAPVLDGDYDAETDRRYLPPPYLGRYPAIEPKIKDIPTSTGGTQKLYDGDIDEYIEDITNNATWEDLDQYIKTGANTTTLTPTAEGTLEVGEVITDGLPYPNVGTDAPADVLTGIGGITGLLQGLTNWLANIANTIANIFTIPADLTLNFDSLRLLNFKDKFPFSIPWDIYRAIAVFAQTPQDPEIGVSLDTEYLDVQHQINLSTIDTPIRFARYVMSIFFILFLATKTRDLIKW